MCIYIYKMPLQHSRSRISEFPSDFCTGLFQTTWSETRPFPSTGETRRVGGNHWRQLLVHRWRCTGKIVFFSWREVLLLNSRGSSADKTKRLSGTRRETARFLGKILEFPRPLVCRTSFPTFGNETFPLENESLLDRLPLTSLRNAPKTIRK